MAKAKIDETLTRFLGNLIRWLVILLAVLACLGVFGVQTTSFAAVLAAAGFAVGLAFQGTLSNFAAGIMLLVFRPFNVGDVVKTGGETGKVFSIQLFTVVLDTFDNRRITIPNSSVFGATIENITHHPIRRADVDVGVDYAADVDRTREILTAAAKSVEGGLEDPEPAVILLGLGASSVDWSVRVWANRDDFGSVKQATIRAVKRALDEAGIGIPFPQMDVHLVAPESTEDGDGSTE
jgi:small conductance mechanosensitive channel